MKHVLRILSSAALLVICVLLAACSGIPGGNGGGGGGGGGAAGPFTISVSVSGLQGTGLTLTNNVTDKLTITGSGTYHFATTITKGAVYAVVVTSQPVNPGQICVLPQGSTGTATANITLNMTCTTGAFSIGGQVNKLQGSGLILQDNLGNNVIDKLDITGNGSFTFGIPVATNGAYSVSVLQQPINPVQTCTVQNSSGNASGNVGDIVITCSVGTIPIGGSVVGLDGTGLTLLDNGGDSLTIKGDGSFTFPTLLVSGTTYTVTIGTQPSGPSQICTVQSNGTGPVTAPGVTNVLINCPPVFEPIGGQVVGLSIPNGMTSQMVLQNNLGDNLPISGNGEFTFLTQIPYNNSYDVTVFVQPGTQDLGIVTWDWFGQATSPVTSVLVDAGHNDWSWLNGKSTANQNSTYTAPPTPITSFIGNTPGGRKYPATWTDNSGNLWLFGGYGYTQTTDPVNQPWWQNDMWVYNGSLSYYEGVGVYWDLHAIVEPPLPAAQIPQPSGRWGSVTWTDASGKLWLFGGQDQFLNFLNDLWIYDTSTHKWACISQCGANNVPAGLNLPGVYGTQGVGSTSNSPGGRWGSTVQLDSAGNVWLFGGFGYDSHANSAPGLLNDLWTYNIASGQWTWMAATNWTGSTTTNTANQDGVYGTVGTPGGGPGGRETAVSWLDNAGNFWIFGGYNLSGAGTPNAFNDLWKYSGGQWTWVSGASSTNQLGNYGTVGVSASTNVPGARWAPAAWTDAQGIFWLYGGQGYDPAGNGSLGDLWAYNPNAPLVPLDPNPFLPASGQWVWAKGPIAVSQPGAYGQDPSTHNGQCRPHVIDYPGTRYGSGYWVVQTTSGDSFFFMFGGEGYDSTPTSGNGLLNDLWRYIPYP